MPRAGDTGTGRPATPDSMLAVSPLLAAAAETGKAPLRRRGGTPDDRTPVLGRPEARVDTGPEAGGPGPGCR
ncbi:hypothetical protein GCM10009818_38320 [Nakamurella flavida]